MNRRPGRLHPWVGVLTLMLAVASCDSLAVREQEDSRRAATRTDLGGEATRQHQHGQQERLPGIIPGDDATHATKVPWPQIEPSSDERFKGLRGMAAARFGGDALPVLDAHAWDSLVALNKGEAPGLAARADDGGIGDVGHPPRRLQEACDLGDTFTVSSTLYPSSSGCYSPYDPADLYTFVTSAVDRIILPLELFTGEYAGVYFWVSAMVISVDDSGLFISYECESLENVVDGSHPSDVSAWFCYLAGSYYIVTAEAFGLTCGCSEGPTPAPAPVSPTPVDADSPEGESGCGGTDSFAITSSQLAEFDGCYQDAAAEDGDTFFSPTGEKVDGTLAVFPSAVDEQGFDIRWIVGTYAADPEEAAVTCVSTESPNDAHPADSTFACDLTGTGAYTAVTDEQFGLACGCNNNSTSSASTSDVDDLTTSTTTSSSPGARGSEGDTPAPFFEASAAPSSGADRGIGTDVPAPAATSEPVAGVGGGSTVSPEANEAIEALTNGGGGARQTARGCVWLVAGAASALAGVLASVLVAGQGL